MIPPQREINKIIKLALNRTHETSMFTTKSESETLPSFPFILFSKLFSKLIDDLRGKIRTCSSIERKDINAQANPRQQDGSCENYNDARTRLSLTRGTRLYNHGVDLPLIMARDRCPRYNKLPDLNFPLPSRRFLEPGVTNWE